jgi:short-subunit dehydrogenase
MGQKIVVTGATSGIGKEICILLSENNYEVYGTTLNADSEEETTGRAYSLHPCDITDQDSVENFVKWVVEKAGTIDVLVNCAGFGFGGGVEDSTTEEAMRQFNVNLFGTHRITRQILPVMREHGGGRVITIGSMASMFPIPFQGFYSASKMALEGMNMALRMEGKSFNIDATTINPGDVKSDFTVNRGLAAACVQGSTYYDLAMKSIQEMIRSEQNGMSPAVVAQKVLKVISKKRLKPKYLIETKYKVLIFLRRFLSDLMVERILLKLYQK